MANQIPFDPSNYGDFDIKDEAKILSILYMGNIESWADSIIAALDDCDFFDRDSIATDKINSGQYEDEEEAYADAEDEMQEDRERARVGFKQVMREYLETQENEG